MSGPPDRPGEARTNLPEASWLAAGFASANEVIIGGAVDGTITSWNPGAERLFGYAAAEMLGTSMLRLAPPGEEPVVRRLFERPADGDGSDPFRACLLTSRGDTVEVAVSASAVCDADGRCLGSVVLAHDISSLRAAEAERDRLSDLVAKTPEAIGIADAQGTLTYANAALATLAGRPLSELIGRPVDAIMFGLPEARGQEMMEELRAGRPISGEWTADRPDGTRFRAEGTIAPVRAPTGAITHWTFIARDITRRREVEADLAFEATVRTVLATALLETRASDSLADAFQMICDKLATLPGVDYACVEGFYGEDGVIILANHVPEGFTLARGTAIPATHAVYVRERATRGPWAEYWKAQPEDGVWDTLMLDAGLKAVAVGPIAHGDHVDGLLAIGTRQDAFAQALVEKMPGLVSFSTASSALLAERLHERRREVELQATFAAVLGTVAFHPVFQPIVDLASGEVAGYEALTRFDSGQRPDLCFADAWSVGLGPDLEIATLERALAAARRLPSGRWLSLNMSPRLLNDPRLGALVRSANRPIVIEITEHEIIANYGTIRDAVRALGPDVRLSVDDAGAGIANFSHIIELRPDLVKLDISLVRDVNANLGRQAMVVGMRHFARTAGCRLVAEGIETEDEARTLTELGVAFGQGYEFGRPEPVETWLGPDVDARAAPQLARPSRLAVAAVRRHPRFRVAQARMLRRAMARAALFLALVSLASCAPLLWLYPREGIVLAVLGGAEAVVWATIAILARRVRHARVEPLAAALAALVLPGPLLTIALVPALYTPTLAYLAMMPLAVSLLLPSSSRVTRLWLLVYVAAAAGFAASSWMASFSADDRTMFVAAIAGGSILGVIGHALLEEARLREFAEHLHARTLSHWARRRAVPLDRSGRIAAHG